MLLTITTTHYPATDLGYLLHKHPDRFQTVNLSMGKAHIFYPVSTPELTKVCLLLDIDPIELARGSNRLSGQSFSLGHYVNDRPYVASSFMSVALSKAFSTAMNGTCTAKPELAGTSIPLTAKIAVVAAPRGGAILIKRLFEPLGYKVEVERHPLDPKFESWGDSKYFTLILQHNTTIQSLLSHLYVLIPVLDNDKHYYVSKDEIDKLLQKGKGWLNQHPEKDLITKRYLLNFNSLTKRALEELSENKNADQLGSEEEKKVLEKKASLHQQRLTVVRDQLLVSGAKSVIDLGCGEGKLIRLLLKEKQFSKITGMDISYKELSKVKERINWESMPPAQQERVKLFQGALTYHDDRLTGYDAAALVEVIEHIDEERLPALERVVFGIAKPQKVFITTPNKEYNIKYETMQADSMRHTDHRFEWTRSEFENWAQAVATSYKYMVNFLPIGEFDEQVGAPSQMAIFTYGN